MLTPRQLSILQVIVDDFIQTAIPVGSRSLSKKESLPYSSATIRNEMADLEELGFIEKTHTSSGRVPSEKGYRYYVDHLLAPQVIEQDDIAKVKTAFQERLIELEQVVQNSAKILSEMTKYTAIVLGPDVHDNKLRKISIVPVDKKSAVALIVTDTGHIENKMIHLPEGFDAEEIEKMVEILNERLQGVPLTQIHSKLRDEVAHIFKQHANDYEFAMKTLEHDLQLKSKEKVYFGGKTNILSQPEFNDVDKIRMLMQVIEDEKMYEVINKNSSGIQVTIGTENNESALNNVSIITASYTLGEQQIGKIAILGPTRMEYARVIGLLQYFSNHLSQTLANYYIDNEDTPQIGPSKIKGD